MIVLKVCNNFIVKHNNKIHVLYDFNELKQFIKEFPHKIIYTNTFLNLNDNICDIRILSFLINNFNIKYYYFNTLKESFDFLLNFEENFKFFKEYIPKSIEYTKKIRIINNFFKINFNKEKIFKDKEFLTLKYKKKIPDNFSYIGTLSNCNPEYSILNKKGDLFGFNYDIEIFEKYTDNYVKVSFKNIYETISKIYIDKYDYNQFRNIIKISSNEYVNSPYRLIHIPRKEDQYNFFCESIYNDIIIDIIIMLYNNNVKGYMYKNYNLYINELNFDLKEKFKYINYDIINKEEKNNDE